MVTAAGIVAAACQPAQSSRTGPAPEATAPGIDSGPSSAARATTLPRNGLEVIGAMRRAHPTGVLRSVSFTATIREPRVDTTSVRTATGVVAFPGKYRLEYWSSKSGVVRDRERLAVFEAGKRVASSSRVDIAHLLAYDVFAMRTDSTVQWLDIARVRLGRMRRDRWEGRDVLVIGGTSANDTVSTQFWIDEDRLRVLRVIQPDPRRTRDRLDIRFRDFDDVMDVPLPTRIDVYRNGRLAQQHTLTDLTANPSLPSRAFDLQRWRNVRIEN